VVVVVVPVPKTVVSVVSVVVVVVVVVVVAAVSTAVPSVFSQSPVSVFFLNKGALVVPSTYNSIQQV